MAIGTLFAFLFGLLVLHRVFKTLYRLYFHPLSHIPGPILACTTQLPQIYYDVVRGGSYCHVIRVWHERYGPVIRISPDEIHVSDPHSYDIVYPGPGAGRKADKAWKSARLFGTQHSAFGTPGHDLHRERRSMIAPLFTRRAVLDLQGLITGKIKLLVENMKSHSSTGQPINLLSAFGALTGDIISAYAYGESLNLLSDPHFAPDWHAMLTDTAGLGHIGKHANFWPLLNALPDWLVHTIDPKMVRITRMQALTRREIAKVMKRHASLSSADNNATEKQAERHTLFGAILDADAPAQEKSFERLDMEANVVMAAGTTTTADTLAVIVFYLLSDHDMVVRLQNELHTAQVAKSNNMPLLWQDLEHIPYLTAVIKEGLRIHPGVVARLPRINPDGALEICGVSIPRGAAVSMSSLDVQFDPDIFPAPHEFQPERWLASSQGSEQKGKLERYIVAFGRGTRQCVGMTLAWAEMYLALAALFGDGGVSLELFDTREEDVTVQSDRFVAGFARESRGVRVLVLE